MAIEMSSGHGLLRFARQLLTRQRAYIAVGVGGLSSLGNLALSISMAHTTGIYEFGQYAICFSIYGLAVGFVRSAVVEPLLGRQQGKALFSSSLRRASLLGLIISILTVATGVLLNLDYLVVMGIAMHGCVVYDYILVMNVSAYKPLQALLQESIWLCVSFAGAALVLIGIVPPLVGFAIWAGGCAVIAYVATILLRLQLRPGWDQKFVTTKVSSAFGLDFLIGSGSAQLAINMASAVAGLSVVGALRAAGTVLGPVTLVVNAARSLLIPFVSRLSSGSNRSALGVSLTTSLTMGVLALPFLALVWVLPDGIGMLLLGANWAYAKPLLPFLAIELFFVILTAVPFAGHRALLAARNTLVIRIALAAIRIASIVVAAIYFGAIGAALAMAVTAMIGTIVWWWSYSSLLKEGRAR